MRKDERWLFPGRRLPGCSWIWTAPCWTNISTIISGRPWCRRSTPGAGPAPGPARELVFARYRREEGTLNWTDIDFWSRELDLDIPALKEGIRHLIEVHPDTEEFLQFLRQQGKKVALVTNAHYKTLDLKMNHTGLLDYFDEVISSFDLGVPKEDVRLLGDFAREIGL